MADSKSLTWLPYLLLLDNDRLYAVKSGYAEDAVYQLWSNGPEDAATARAATWPTTRRQAPRRARA